ncbi:MAG: bactofilin family protein [Tepidiformaceae bacterium]
MQLKKTGREVGYADPRNATDSDDLAVEGSEDYAVHAADTMQRPNAGRPRTEDEQDAPQPRAQPVAHAESLIDAHSNFDGKYETDQDLRVQGSISGEVVCRGVFTVDQEATARARIQTRDALIRGRVEGDIVCSGRLLLASTSIVTGTLKSATLIVEEGATLTGNVETAAGVGTPRASGAAAPATVPAAETRRNPTPLDERRNAAEAVAAGNGNGNGNGRNGRQAPNFAFVPADDRVAADRN